MKIAILEKSVIVDSSTFDKIISFVRGEYIDVDSYISPDEASAIREDILPYMDKWFKDIDRDNVFEYRKVELLPLFRIGIFGFLSNLCQKQSVVSRIVEKDNPSGINIVDVKKSIKEGYPYIKLFALEGIPPSIKVGYINDDASIDTCSKRKNLDKIAITLVRKIFTPLKWIINYLNESKKDVVLVLSDIPKVKGILAYLTNNKVIVLRERLPVTLFWTLFKEKTVIKLFSDFDRNLNTDANYNKKSKEFIAKLSEVDRPLVIENFDFGPYVKMYLKESWESQMADVLKNIDRIFHIFQTIKIKSVLLDEDKSINNNVIVQVSKKFKAETYVNCHGDPSHKVSFLPLLADKIMVWGNEQKKTLEKWGLGSDRILVSGCSKYEPYLLKSKESVRSEMCKKFRFNKNKLICLFAPVPVSEKYNVFKIDILKKNEEDLAALVVQKDLQIIVKLHPSDDGEAFLKNIAKKIAPKRIRVVKKYDSLDLCVGIDFMVAGNTTFAIDALAFRKPVVSTERRSLDKYGFLGYFYDGTTAEGIKKSVRQILEIQGQKGNSWEKASEYLLNGVKPGVCEFIANELTGKKKLKGNI